MGGHKVNLVKFKVDGAQVVELTEEILSKEV
jgi:hypothetical protein